MVLAALLGDVQGYPDPIAEDGGVRIGPQHSAHPWLMQLCMDLRALNEVDDMEEVIGTFTLPDGRLNIKGLLLDAREELLRTDVHQLKRAYLSHAIAPPGATAVYDLPGCEHYDPNGTFVCHLRQAEGDECLLTFKSRKALATHQRLAIGGEHGSRCYLALMINDPICPICASTFKTKHTARHHVRLALERG